MTYFQFHSWQFACLLAEEMLSYSSAVMRVALVLCKYVCIIFYTAVYIEQIRHKSVHKSSVPDSDTLLLLLLLRLI